MKNILHELLEEIKTLQSQQLLNAESLVYLIEERLDRYMDKLSQHDAASLSPLVIVPKGVNGNPLHPQVSDVLGLMNSFDRVHVPSKQHISAAAKEHMEHHRFFTQATANQKRLSFYEGAVWLLHELSLKPH